MAPSALTTRSLSVAISASERSGRTAEDTLTDECDAVSEGVVGTGPA
jgi:hypothetical protein